MKANTKYTLMFLIILVIQVLLIVFWGNRKENLYWDEFYTLEGAHYFSDSNSEEHYIDEDSDFKVGEWLPVSIVKDTLIVGEKETILKEPFSEVLKKLTGYHNYSAYLNIAESLWSLGEFSIWPAILLNIVFFVLNQMVIFLMCRKISMNETFSLAVCSMYGFSSMCISMAVFIRCYMLATLLVSLFTCIHLFYYETDGKNAIVRIKRLILLILAIVPLYIVHNIAQYSIIYGGIFVIAFSVLLFVKKGLKRFLYYAIPMIGGGFFFLYTQTSYLQILFDFQKSYSEAYAALGATLEGIVDFKIILLPERILDMAHILGRYLFGSFIAMIVFIVIIGVASLTNIVCNSRTSPKSIISSFIIVLSLASLVYLIIFAIFGLYEQVRYISFVFPELATFVMAIVFKTFKSDRNRYVVATIIVLVIIVGVNAKGKIDMLYTGDRDSIERIRDVDANSFLICAGNHRTLITYETAFVAEDDDEFFVYDDIEDKSMDNLKSHLRDRMILVGYHGVSTGDVQDMLKDNGYQVEWIADTYNYVFYDVIYD